MSKWVHNLFFCENGFLHFGHLICFLATSATGFCLCMFWICCGSAVFSSVPPVAAVHWTVMEVPLLMLGPEMFPKRKFVSTHTQSNHPTPTHLNRPSNYFYEKLLYAFLRQCHWHMPPHSDIDAPLIRCQSCSILLEK